MVRTMGKGSDGASSSSKSQVVAKGKTAKSLAQKRRTIISRRPIHPERGIDIEALQDTSIPTLIDQIGWKNVADQRLPYNPDVVKEFYTELVPAQFLKTGKVKVQGREVAITATKINEYFGLDDQNYEEGLPPIEIFTKSNPKLAAAPRMEEDYFWDPSTAPLKHGELTIEAAFFNTFCTFSINPAGHYSTLSDKNARLVYCLINGLEFDLGQVMTQTMCDASDANKKNSVLPFPGIISYFCNEAGIPVFNDPNHWMACRPPLNATTYNHLAVKRGLAQLPSAYVQRKERAARRRQEAEERESASQAEVEEQGASHHTDTPALLPPVESQIPPWVTELLTGQQAILARQEAINKRMDEIEEKFRQRRGDT